MSQAREARSGPNRGQCDEPLSRHGACPDLGPTPDSGWGCRKRSRLPPPLTATLVCVPDINGLKGPVMARDPCVLWPSHTSCFQEKRPCHLPF